eukprot:gene12620-3326_t
MKVQTMKVITMKVITMKVLTMKALTMKVLTMKVLTMKVLAMKVLTMKVQRIKVQTMKVLTMKVLAMKVLTMKVQTMKVLTMKVLPMKVKAVGSVSVDPDAAQKLQIDNDDFQLALQNDIKPAFGAHIEDFENFIANGIIKWGSPFEKALDDCKLLIQQTRNGALISPVSVLLEGCLGSGKTALAASLAETAGFPFVKVCSPEHMIGFTEGAKCQAIKKIFDDAYKSELSCIVVDDIERLIDFVPVGLRFSNVVLQALMVLLKRGLPKGRKLLIIGTTSCRDVLKEMQLLQIFHNVIHIPAITRPSEIMTVVQGLNQFEENELAFIEENIINISVNIGVKKLLGLAEMALQDDASARAQKFVTLLENWS